MKPRVAARFAAAGIVTLVCFASLDSPFRPSAASGLRIQTIAPQAWGFFTSARDDQVEVFRLRDGQWMRIDAPLSAPANLFGLRRSTLNHGAEFRTIAAQVGDRWSTAALGPDDLPGSSEALSVRNLAREPRLCGELLLVSRPALPWAWSTSSGRLKLATRFARMQVQC